ncbi:hypothetical protein BDZ45DRAFT_805242 [Acephala macrosclerotiorum]|nr:hypothetical protein BDZ45DRAFT_805242 [Acephala macrosclerotiorum]
MAQDNGQYNDSVNLLAEINFEGKRFFDASLPMAMGYLTRRLYQSFNSLLMVHKDIPPPFEFPPLPLHFSATSFLLSKSFNMKLLNLILTISALLPSLISSSPLPHPEPTASPSIIEKRNFKDSCNNIGFDGRYLTADCRTFAGNYVHNQVDLNNCIGDSRGVLTHPGSGFASQCQNWEHWASTIRGLCLDSGHVLRYTEIDIGFIENQNGVLAGC